MRITLLGNDKERTVLTLDVDPDKVKVLDDHTIETPPPPFWLLDDKRCPVDASYVLRLWYDDQFDALKAMGITVYDFSEDGVTVEHPRAGSAAPADGANRM